MLSVQYRSSENTLQTTLRKKRVSPYDRSHLRLVVAGGGVYMYSKIRRSELMDPKPIIAVVQVVAFVEEVEHAKVSCDAMFLIYNFYSKRFPHNCLRFYEVIRNQIWAPSGWRWTSTSRRKRQTECPLCIYGYIIEVHMIFQYYTLSCDGWK